MRTDRDIWLVIFNIIFLGFVTFVAINFNPSDWLYPKPLWVWFIVAIGVIFLIIAYRNIKSIDDELKENDNMKHNQLIASINKLAQEIREERIGKKK